MTKAADLLETIAREPTASELDDAGTMLQRIEAHRQRAAALREACDDLMTWERAYGWDGLPPYRAHRGGF